MAKKQVARLGDRTDHRGTIITASGTVSANKKKMARVGDLVSCPRCGRNPIVSGVEGALGQRQPVAVAGSRTACGSTVIGGSSDVFVNPQVDSNQLLNMEESLEIYDEQFRVVDPATGGSLAGVKYEIVTGSGLSLKGVTGEDGLTRRVFTGDKPETLTLYYS